MKTPRLVRGVFFRLEKTSRQTQTPVGAAEGCDLLILIFLASPKNKIKRSQPSAAQTGVREASGDEAFVMKLTAMRLNVADYADCRTVSNSATNSFQTQSFT
jgi:hypothetical protein